MTNGLVLCHFGCGARINPNDRTSGAPCTAGNAKASATAAAAGPTSPSEPRSPQFACDRCIERLKPGLAPAQETLPML